MPASILTHSQLLLHTSKQLPQLPSTSTSLTAGWHLQLLHQVWLPWDVFHLLIFKRKQLEKKQAKTVTSLIFLYAFKLLKWLQKCSHQKMYV